MEKMSIKEQLVQVKAFVEGKETVMTQAEMVAFIEGRIAQLEKKAQAGKGKAKVEKAEDVALKAKIKEMIEAKGAMSVKELRGEIAGLTSQKAVAMLKQLIAIGEVEKVMVEKETKYQVCQ